MKKLLSLTALLFSLSLLLTGCGGGSSSSPTTSTKANGYWSGTSIEDGADYRIGITLYNGESFIRIAPNEVGDYSYYSGAYLINDNNLSIDLISSTGAKATVSATLDDQNNIEGTLTSTDGLSSAISLTYSDQFDTTPSNLEEISGTWTLDYSSHSLYMDSGYQYTGEYWYTTLTISSDGSVMGSNDMNCIFNGNITTPDTSKPLYLVDIDVSNCGTYNGKLKGFATYLYSTAYGYELNLNSTLNEEPSVWYFIK